MTPELIERYGDRLHSHSVEINIPNAAAGKVMLPDDSILRSERIVAGFIPDNRDNSAKSPLGKDLASNAAVRSCYVTLKHNNKSILEDHPLSDLLTTENDRSLRLFDICKFNPSKSFITFGDPTLLSNDESIMLQVLYVKDN